MKTNLTFSRNFLRLRGYYGMVCRYDIRSISGTVHSPRFPQNILLFENREILRHFVSLHRFFNSVKLRAQEELATYFARHISILKQNCSAKIDR